jgi:hypothetical protein
LIVLTSLFLLFTCSFLFSIVLSHFDCSLLLIVSFFIVTHRAFHLDCLSFSEIGFYHCSSTTRLFYFLLCFDHFVFLLFYFHCLFYLIVSSYLLVSF